MGTKIKRKAILVISDGIGDIPISNFQGKTPLEAAVTPTLDHIADLGICGLMHPIGLRVPGSDTSHLALFGYNPEECYRGRGALEALGAGISLEEDDVAFRVNFATVNNEFMVLDRRAGRTVPQGATLMEVLNKIKLTSAPDVSVKFKHTIEHRGVLVLSGPNLSSNISDTDPHQINVPLTNAKPIDNEPASIRTANIINELTYQIHRSLKDHPINKERVGQGLPPANILLIRGAGQKPLIRPLHKIYPIKPAFIAAAALIRGVCKAVGMEEIPCPEATGTYETNVIAKGKATLKALKRFNFVFTHFKATDNAGHDKNPVKKKKMCEKLDILLDTIWKGIDPKTTILLVTGDHSTPVDCGDHTSDPLPLLMYSPTVRRDTVTSFGERSCSKGGLGHIQGADILPIIINQMRLGEKFGA